MRQRLSVIACLGLGLMAASCSGPATVTNLQWAPAQRAAGEWQWVRSLDVRTLDVRTPATEGFDATLVIIATSDRDGTYTYTRTGSSPVAGAFAISSEDGPGNDFVSIDTPIDFLTRNAWITSSADSLRLGGVFESGFNSVYVRVR